MKISAVILAAGHGTRMLSSIPKVLHPLMGKAMMRYSVEAASAATGSKPVIIVGYQAEHVRQTIGESAQFAIQDPQLGTGHAVQQAEELLRDKADLILVLTADMPLLTERTLRQVLNAHQSTSDQNTPITMLTVNTVEPRGFGRVLRDRENRLIGIVEEAQATPEQLSIQELNASVYCFDANWLWEALPRIPLSPKGEYYLTDLVGIAEADGKAVQAVSLHDPEEAIGINTRVHLAEASAILRERINRSLMLGGVTLIDPGSTYVEAGVQVGQDTVIWPNTYLHGDTLVGRGCNLGPNTIIRDSQLGDNCRVLSSVLEGARLDDEVEMGPFARLRKSAHLGRGVHMGNFGEVKNSYLGPGTKMGHFSYIGDTTTGPEVNIGAGTVTCNYDGEQKHHTEIGARAFIGSDTMLVAPVRLGAGARTGAGAVVTRNVPDHTLAVGAPARSIRKLEKK